MRGAHFILGLSSIVIGSVSTVLAQEMSVDVSAVADTFIVSGGVLADNNAGGHAHVASGTSGTLSDRRGLFRFDVSGIPAGSTIVSASLEMVVVNVPGFNAADSNFDLHRLLAAWGEGTKSGPGGSNGSNGAPATSGEATWNNRRHGIAPWTVPGAGGDFHESPSASAFVSGLGAYTWSSPELAADVQHWVDDPSLNHGWLLRSRMEGVSRSARSFGSREGGNPARLTISYMPMFVIESIVVEGDPTLSFQSSTDLTYGLQYTGDLLDPAWTNLVTDVPGTGGILMLSDPDGAASEQRAYRATITVPDP